MFTLRLVHSSIHSLTPATMYRAATAQCLAWKTFDWIASSYSERNRGTDRMAPLCIPHLHARQSAVSLDEPRDATTVRDEWGWQCLVSELSRFVGHTERRFLVDGPPQDSNSQCDKKLPQHQATARHCYLLSVTTVKRDCPNETKMDYPTVFIQHWRLLKYFEFDLCCCCLCCYRCLTHKKAEGVLFDIGSCVVRRRIPFQDLLQLLLKPAKDVNGVKMIYRL